MKVISSKTKQCQKYHATFNYKSNRIQKKMIIIFFDVIQTNIHFLFALFVLEQAQLGLQEVLFEIVIKEFNLTIEHALK